jgi:hypothetical protein
LLDDPVIDGLDLLSQVVDLLNGNFLHLAASLLLLPMLLFDLLLPLLEKSLQMPNIHLSIKDAHTLTSVHLAKRIPYLSIQAGLYLRDPISD